MQISSQTPFENIIKNKKKKKVKTTSRKKKMTKRWKIYSFTFILLSFFLFEKIQEKISSFGKLYTWMYINIYLIRRQTRKNKKSTKNLFSDFPDKNLFIM